VTPSTPHSSYPSPRPLSSRPYVPPSFLALSRPHHRPHRHHPQAHYAINPTLSPRPWRHRPRAIPEPTTPLSSSCPQRYISVLPNQNSICYIATMLWYTTYIWYFIHCYIALRRNILTLLWCATHCYILIYMMTWTNMVPLRLQLRTV
jgi:hypothetical protein